MGDLCDSSCASLPGCLNRFSRFHRIPSDSIAVKILRIPRPLQRCASPNSKAQLRSTRWAKTTWLWSIWLLPWGVRVSLSCKMIELTYRSYSSKKEATLTISVSKCFEMSSVVTWHYKNQVRQWRSRAWALHIHPRNTSRATDLRLSGTAGANQKRYSRLTHDARVEPRIDNFLFEVSA